MTGYSWSFIVRLKDARCHARGDFAKVNEDQIHSTALESAWITGFNEKKKNMHNYKEEFFERGGKLHNEARGKYKRHCLFNEESRVSGHGLL